MPINVVQINLGNFGSTGSIMKNIIQNGKERGFRFLQMYPDSPHCQKEKGDFIICSYFWQRVYQKLYYYFGVSSCWNKLGTKRVIRRIKKFKPDIIHLHNLHNEYLDVFMLFKFIQKNRIKVVWTFHDCWPFTGRCPHFVMINCNKWLTGCCECPYGEKEYPSTKLDKAALMWKKKKDCFNGVDNLNIVTPSKWLSELVKKSFLNNHSVSVINNGINLNVFKPIESTFKEDYHILNKHMLLAVSFDWGIKKGLDVIVKLSNVLPSDYQIVLVGVSDKDASLIPQNIITIKRTHNQTELAKIYTAADLFINPTREDNYPTVNMEALACGTPVLTFKTGGSPEIVDNTCGSVVECDDFDGFKNEIIRICDNKVFSRESCLKKAKSFDMFEQTKKYLELYSKILNFSEKRD